MSEEVKINEELENIKTLWEKKKEVYKLTAKIEKEIDDVVEDWEKYKKIIKSTNGLSLDEYTNLTINKTDLPGGYLCNFLEVTSKNAFGTSKPGTAVNYMVKKNRENEDYYIKNHDKNTDKSNATEVEATKYFDDNIKKILKNIVEFSNVQDIIKNINEVKNYAGYPILMKMAVLCFPEKFIYIYDDKIINDLYKKIFPNVVDKKTRIQKNYDLMESFSSIIEISDNSSTEINENIYKIKAFYDFLWDYLTFKVFDDKDGKNIILHGPPGTGKTFLVKKFLDFKYPNKEERQKHTKEIQFHPSYTYEDFIDGLKPVGVTNGQLNLELVNGHFKDFCIEASKDLCNDYYFIVDEINRANLSSVFGELLTQLEYRVKPLDDYNKEISLEDWRKDKETNGKCINISDDDLKKLSWSNLIELQNSNLSNVLNKESVSQEFAKDGDKFKFGIPENVYFIGMMNDVDKSIESFDLALRRRFKWKKMECDYDIITAILNYNNLSDYEELCKTFNKYISENRKDNLGLGKQYELGHSYFLKIEDYTKKRKDISNSHLNSLFDNHIEPILTEYLRLNYEEIEIESKISEAKKKFQFETSKNENNSNSNDNEINNE